MGFYGQVVYEFKKLFSSLKIIKKVDSETAIEPPASDTEFKVQALQPWDELTLTPSNRWIQLSGDPVNKSITIGHSIPGATDDSKTVVGLSRVEESAIPEGTEVTALDYGDYIQTTVSEYDAAGHSKGATTAYFKMPLGETVDNVNQLQEDMKYVYNNFLNTIEEYSPDPENPDNLIPKGKYVETYLTENGYVNTETLGDAMQKYLNDEGYVTSAVTGYCGDMYPTLAEYPTIAETIGAVTGNDGFSKSVAEMTSAPNADEAQYTISDAVKLVAENIVTDRNNLNGINARLTILVQKLKELGIDVGTI